MLCPLAKVNGGNFLFYVGRRISLQDNIDERSEIRDCDTFNCAWWDPVGEQCSMVTIALELTNIRKHGTNVRD